LRYFERIDGLRFFAILLVLIEHFAPIIAKYFSAGYYGVDLFFSISGFLITTILLNLTENKKEISFKQNYINFMGRRILRIFPIYYLTIILLWILNEPIVHSYLFWLLTYTYNYALVAYHIPNSPLTHFWSLAVEEQFYLLWPIIILSIANKPKTLLFIVLFIILFGYTQMIFELIPILNKFNYFAIYTRGSSLAIGALAAVLSKKYILPEKVFRNKYMEYLMFIVLLFALITDFKIKYLLFGITSFYLVLKAAYFNFSNAFFDKFLLKKWVLKIGILSYGIYVYHLPIDYFFTKYIFDPIWSKIDFSVLGKFEIVRWNSWLIKFPLYSTLSIMIANLSFKFIEKPILKLKDRFFNYGTHNVQ